MKILFLISAFSLCGWNNLHSDPVEEVWMPNPSISRVGNSKIWCNSVYSRSTHGKVFHQCSFGTRNILPGDNQENNKFTDILVLPELHNDGVYTWSIEDKWLVVKKAKNESVVKWNIESYLTED